MIAQHVDKRFSRVHLSVCSLWVRIGYELIVCYHFKMIVVQVLGYIWLDAMRLRQILRPVAKNLNLRRVSTHRILWKPTLIKHFVSLDAGALHDP